jgi:enoyl-CoA hydratase
MSDTAAPAPLVGLERLDNGVAVVTLQNPKVNALASGVLGELHAVVESLAADLPGAVVLTGGDKVFAAGADITEFDSPEVARELGGLFVQVGSALAGLPRVTIAAIAGFALGGGLEVALACDFRMVTTNARLGLPEIQLGILPGGGGTQRLPRLIGPSRAKELILSGRHVRADEALSIGLADRVVDPESLRTAAVEWAETFATGALVAQGLAKGAVDRGLQVDLDTGLAIEQDAFVEVFRSDDARIGIASFLEHGPGKAAFTGR